jgi:two-component system capsular synthesis response regulator RcsB
MTPLSIRVVVADDHPAIIKGIQQELAEAKTVDLVGAAGNSTELINLLDKHPCDVLVTDYAMPGGEYGDGLALFKFIQRRYPNINIIVMTMLDNPAVLRTLIASKIHCVLSKSDDSSYLLPAIHIAHSGGEYFSPTMRVIMQTVTRGNKSAIDLTKRELEVVRLLVSGLTVNEVAEQLHRSKQTVSAQKINAMKKLGIERDADLFKYAMEVGLITSSAMPP